jgi:predicted outer membrane repeat protein
LENGDEAGDGGGIAIAGNLTLSNAVVQNSSATAGGGGVFCSSGSLTMNSVNVTGNSAGNGDGGGLELTCPTTITGGSISNNSQTGNGRGGGLAADSTTVSLTNVTLDSNSAEGDGGGIGADAAITITGTTISNNSASGNGGGIDDGAGLTITNSTIAGNSASPVGGSIHGYSGANALTFVTISGNSGSDSLDGTAFTLRGTIVDDNAANNCSAAPTDLGFNIDSGATCGFSGTGSLSNTNPLLGALAGNGGPTQTMAPGAGSPAIDAVTAGCPPPATDQRGITRPQGARCDIGAVEAAGAAPPTPTPTALPAASTLPPAPRPPWSPLPLLIGFLAVAAAVVAAAVRRRRRTG